MRKRFEPQLELWQLLIEDTPTPRSRDGMADLAVALRELYKNKVYRDRILDIMESKLITGKPSTGRPGMELWRLFVPARMRLSKNLSYETEKEINDVIVSFGQEEVFKKKRRKPWN